MAGKLHKPIPLFGSRTDVGCIREHNEDSLAVEPPLYVVCDGMGGHAAGEVASEIAVRVITERAPQHADAEALGQAVEEANLAIIRAAHEGRGKEGMGTTCTAAILEGERLVLAQVGDSRAYLLHHGRLQQVTRDHSLVADLVDAGQITPAEARIHPQRSIITRALGSDPRTQPDLFEINVEAGDRLLLCPDGLSTMLEDNEIQTILDRNRDPQRCAAQLVNEAIRAGGYDNVTVIVVDISGLAEKRQRKVARKTKITAAAMVVLLAAIVAGAVWLFNWFSDSSAYLTVEDGHVAIYQGLQGELFGFSNAHLVETTDVAVEDLVQPGLANRLETDGIPCASVEEAQALVDSYREEIASKERMPGGVSDTDAAADNNSAASDATAASDRGQDSAGQAASSSSAVSPSPVTSTGETGTAGTSGGAA